MHHNLNSQGGVSRKMVYFLPPFRIKLVMEI
jgi:hypothetical protein